jgi:TPR repeat protein
VKQALSSADEVVLVAGPDLASMRNAKSMLEAMTKLREGKSAPLVALSMVGVPKRPEINAKDFTEAVGASPAASFAFDPLLHGVCETNNQMIGQADPECKTALALDALAASLTGRKPSAKKRAAETAILARDTTADFAKSPKRGKRELAPAADDHVLVLTRETSIDTLSASFSNATESAYLAKARSAAQAELDAVKQERRRPIGWTRITIAASAAGLALASAAWRAEPQTRTVIAPAPAVAAAAAPAPASQYASALLLFGEGRAAEGFALLQSAAQSGFAPAQHHLAKLYESGEGAPANAALARAWTERAAANGNVRAMHDLGVYYAQSEDSASAFRWFRQAAEFGHADSQYNLGVLYHDGAGVSADLGEALFWFHVAATQGDAEAQARAIALAATAPSALAAQARARAEDFAAREPNAAANTR